ncbi:hypothetical protein D8674_018804 [Pyrus ussuriensis x Pyrus communis]|uniref:Uncharacterized protein n=1 Tax=Pyrus ussuriensis x Pyrus communis TaxID=2448454 RepID=A0A5N5GBF2_9ROSA|nr:hypothetical protein D8674_018804 [Pyrus ussuriensis x Pyrus communis]
MVILTRRGNCIQANKVTGTLESSMVGITIHDCRRTIIRRAAENAIIMVAIAKKRVARPIIIFVGKDLRKSSSA